MYGISDKEKNIHTWIEFEEGKNEYVIDYTFNVLMNKEGYYYLRKAEPLSIITSKEMNSDRKLGIFDKDNEMANGKGIGISEKEYLLFRNEILNDLLKNSFVNKDDVVFDNQDRPEV